MSLVVEVVIDLAVRTDKFLKCRNRLETLHRSFSSSKWQMWIFTSVVGSAAAKLSVSNSNLTKSRAVGWQLVSRDNLWRSVLSHYFYEKFLRCSLVPPFGNIAFQNFAFVINSTPKVKSLTVDFDENFIQMPLPVRVAPYPPFADLISKFCTKSVYPKSYCLMTNINSTLM